MTRSLACLALLSILAGCGQTGPLYLPDQTPPPSQRPLSAAVRGHVPKPGDAAPASSATTTVPAAPASTATPVSAP